MQKQMLLALLLGVITLCFATFTNADPGIVLSLDENPSNGPDTVSVEQGDTVLVHVWITGTDSLYAFGITFGDTTGNLTWVEDSASAIFTTPGSWADIPIQQDSLGFLLLQPVDLSFDSLLILPSEVAQLRYLVSAQESLSTRFATLDSLCGCQDVHFTERSFVGFESPVIIINADSLMDGSAGGQGDSFSSDLSAEDMQEILAHWEGWSPPAEVLDRHLKYQYPSHILEGTSTDSLIRIVITSPLRVYLNCLTGASFNQEFSAWERSSNVLRELLKRDDAAVCLYAFYAGLKVELPSSKNALDTSTIYLSSFPWLEAILGDDRVLANADNALLKNILAAAVEKAQSRKVINQRASKPIFSNKTFYCARLIGKCLKILEYSEYDSYESTFADGCLLSRWVMGNPWAIIELGEVYLSQ